MHILIAEDDAALSNGLSRALRQSGYAVDCVQDGQQADTALVGDRFDLLILDLGLPLVSGLEVLRRARARGARLPILILTASDGVNDRVRGLDLGADDYMVKPFDLPELEARIRALARRGLCGAAPTLQVGPLSMDPASRVAVMHGKRLGLSARELAVLEVLVRRAGRLVNKEELVDHLCEWGEEVSANAIEFYVHRLRKKIEGSSVRIATVRGLGYCLEALTDS